MITYSTAIVLLGVSLLGAAAGLAGVFALLRQRALLGDALAHAALPGVCLAFLFLDALLSWPAASGALHVLGVDEPRNFLGLLGGAWLTGLLGIALIAGLRRFTPIREDAAVGIVLSVFFGAGVVLSRVVQNGDSLASKAGLDSFILGKTAGILRSDVYVIAAVAVVVLLAVVVLYKEFKLIAFDPAYARAQGWPVARLDAAIMLLVSFTVVAGLPTIGVVLSAALLVLPAAAARFWTNRLGVLLTLSACFGLLIGALGTLWSSAVDKLPAGPMIVLTGSAVFLASFFLAPNKGLAARLLRQRRWQRTQAERRLLLALWEESAAPSSPTLSSGPLARRLGLTAQQTAQLCRRGQRQGWIEAEAGGSWNLTAAGRQAAEQFVQGRALWRAWLARHPESARDALDLSAVSPAACSSKTEIAALQAELQAAGAWPDTGPAAQRGGRP